MTPAETVDGPTGRRVTEDVLEVATAHGPARVRRRRPDDPRGLVILTHGANGAIGTKDLLALATALPEHGWSVALVEQAFVVAGRRTPPRAPAQDEAYLPVVAALVADVANAAGGARVGPVVLGGRSNGARVACRTAVASGGDGVLCLAFPLHPPGAPDRSRADELARPYAADLPVLVVQGRTDAFGTPAEVFAAAPAGAEIVEVPGGHGFTANPVAVVEAVLAWLGREWPPPSSR